MLWIPSLVAALLAPAPQEEGPRPAPTVLSCTGLDALSWRLELVETRGYLTVPPDRPVRLEGRFSVDDERSFGWRGRALGGGRDLVAFVSESVCTTAALEEDPFSVRVSLPDGRFVSGCCQRVGEARPEKSRAERLALPSPAPTPAPVPGDWISSLPTFYPAIKECVDGRGVEAVVFAAIKPDRTTHLVLRMPEDRYADCLLPPGRGPAKISLRPPNAPRSPEEQAAILSLLATPPPMEPCYRPQAVLDEQGQRLGWIALKGC